MSVTRIKNHGTWVYQARVAYQGRRKAAFRATRDEARQAEATLLGELKAQASASEEEAQRPATLRQLFEFYVADLEARGKGPDTIGRAVDTAHVVERLLPTLLERPAGQVTAADVFAFRPGARARGHQGQHHQPGTADVARDAQPWGSGVSLPGRRVPARRRDTGPMAPAGG